ncbi:MAG: UDP-N-acetylmuramoylalanyl-D-glutamyl-2,6-diaminopimelate--D-alanyl-D-alanine ligase [Sphingomonadales bacterium]
MAEHLWTSNDAAAAVNGQARGEWTCTGVAIDSREVKADDLFIALKGEKSDGHGFVASALERGASAAMVCEKLVGLADDAPVLVVSDTMSGLQSLGQAARARVQTEAGATIVAVTGSVGKTGTKEALRTVLARQGIVHASVRSFNNHVGVPLSLARMPRATDFGVFELGMNRPGEIGPLSRMVRPHVAVITTIEPAHSAFFPSIEDIARSKAEVFEGLQAGGVAVLNRDNPQFGLLSSLAREAGVETIIAFGEHEDADARLLKYRMHHSLSCVSADICGQTITYKIGIPGRHWIMNSLAVLGTAAAVGADLGLAGLALADVAPLAGRGKRHEVRIDGDKIVVIDESYNASPASMRSALAAMAAMHGGEPHRHGRRIAVLGDMLELGDSAAREHESLAEPVLEAGVDLVFGVGNNMVRLMETLPRVRRAGHADSAETIASLVAAQVRPGDLVMIKGSNALGLNCVVEALVKLGKRRCKPEQIVSGDG